jgi:hypothetical protein
LHFAKLANHDVRRLQIAVDHAATVGVGDRLANLLEHLQITRQVLTRIGPRRQQLGESSALNQFHREIRPALVEAPHLVDRDDAGMLQTPADLCLLDEATSQSGIVRTTPKKKALKPPGRLGSADSRTPPCLKHSTNTS